MQRSTRREALTVTSILTLATLALVSGSDAAVLQPRTAAAWDAYIEVTERQMAHRIERRIRADQAPEDLLPTQHLDTRDPTAEAKLRRGDILVTRMQTRGSTGSAIDIPKGEVHHWRGRMFISGMSVDDVLHSVKRPLRPQDLQEDVLESRQLHEDEHGSKVFLKLRRKKFVTVHYNTEHEVRYVRHDGLRASSRSVATRIAELKLKHAGTSREEEHPVGNDRGSVAFELLLALRGSRGRRDRRV